MNSYDSAGVAYQASQYPNYDQDLCYRDVGLIVDAVARDLALETNYNTITAGYAYLRANSAYVLSDQKQLTIDAVNYAREQTKALAGVTSDSIVDSAFDRITDVLEGRVTAYEVPTYTTTSGSTYQTSARINAANALQSNREDAADAVIDYINTNFPNVGYDQDKCKRDTLYVIDALTHDVKYGGNTAILTSSRAYFSGGASQLGGVDEKLATISAYEYLITYVNENVIVTGDEQLRVSELVNVLTGVINDGNLDNLPDSVEPTFDGVSKLSQRNAIAQARPQIQDDTITFVNRTFFEPSYDQAKCFRDVGLILDAVRRDLILGTDYNTITAANAYLRANSAYVLSNQNEATINAITFARNQVKALVDITSDATIDTLFQRILDVLDGTTTSYTTPSFPTTTGSTYQTADRIAAASALQSNRANIISDTKAYIQGTLGLTGYDSVTCDRDVGYIVDGLTHDIKYGGNTGARTNALAYFAGTVNQLGNDTSELNATLSAYNQLKGIVNTYVTTATEQVRTSSLLDIIIEVLEADTDSVIQDEVEIDTSGLNDVEYQAIQNNTVAIQNDVIDYVNDNNPVGGFDDEKCARDTALIIDAICLDLELNTNYNSTTAGLAYSRAVSAKVTQEQKEYTIQTIQYLGGLLQNQTSDVVEKNFISERITEITDLIEQASDYGNYDGDPLNFTGSASIEFDKRVAQQALQSNRRKIQTQIITFIETNYDTLEYNQDACIRDLGYIVDALSHDILFDVDYGTETVARSYWNGVDLYGPDQNLDGEADVYTKLLGSGETVATASAYEELKSVIAKYVTTATEQARINTLIDVIIASIQADDPTAIPSTSLSFTGTSSTINGLKTDLVERTVAYANQIFPAFNYDQTTCKRDVGYILDALTYDIKYGGNSATYTAQRAYFSIFGNGYVDLLGQNELNATISAYTQLKTILAPYFTSVDAGIQTKAENLLDIIIEAITQSRDGTYTLGEFFNNNSTRDEIYQYNVPSGLPTGYDVLVFPNLITLGYKVVYNELYNAHQTFDLNESQRLTIIRSASAVARNQGTDSTIFLKSGDYIVNNPIKLPPKTSIIGDALRSTTIRPKNVDSDIFWADNAVYIKEITFRDHQDGAACLAFDPRVDSPGAGPFITQSPYVQNCTSLTSSGIGLRIDGSKVSGLRSMVLDAFTQFNAGGIGVYLLNRGYSQLVSLFTVSTTTSVLAETGGQCSLTNSNSSFGKYGLVSRGGSKSLYNGDLHATYDQNEDLIRINTIITQDSADYTLNLGDFKKPNYNDAIRFDSDNYYYTVLDVSDEITQDWASSRNSDESLTFAVNTKVNNALFGYSTNMSRDDLYLVVTEPSDASGKAEIYEKDFIGGVPQWIYQALIQPTTPFGSLSGDEFFGYNAVLDGTGTYVAVTALNQHQTDATVSTRNNGAVYTFRRTGTSWAQDSFIALAGVTDRDRYFGESLDMSEDGLTMAIGNRNDETDGGQGAVYIYLRANAGSNVWTQQQRLTCPDGSSVAVTLPTVTLSEDGQDLLVAWSGPLNKVYYYQRNIDNLFILAQVITPTSNFLSQREVRLKMNPTSDYFVMGDGKAPRGYFINGLTDGANGVPSYLVRKQKLDNVNFTNTPAKIVSTDADVDFNTQFSVGSTLTLVGADGNDGDYVITSLGVDSARFAGSFAETGAKTNVQAYVKEQGVAEMFRFEEGQWITEEVIEAPYQKRDRINYGANVDINSRGLLVSVGMNPQRDSDSCEVSILERAAKDWTRVTRLVPNPLNSTRNTDVNNDKYGATSHWGPTVGGSGDFIAIGASEKRETLSNASTEYGSLFTYYSILPETGSYEVTISPPLNKQLLRYQNCSFHQRSLITASGHTFEYVGSGTNMFTAIPQNGGIPIKENEVVFDSAEADTPNFGLVYFTATDELGDFRIGEDLRINREEGTITGVTFDRSLFAVLTPFILALEGGS